MLQLPSMSDSSPRVDDIYIQLCKFVDLKDSSVSGPDGMVGLCCAIGY